MATANITQGTSAVVLDTRMWAGSDPTSTAWLQTPIGTNAAVGGLNLLIVDLICTAASTLTKLDFSDTTITGVDGTTALSILGIQNLSGGYETPTLPTIVLGVAQFTTAASTVGDTHRLTLLYS